MEEAGGHDECSSELGASSGSEKSHPWTPLLPHSSKRLLWTQRVTVRRRQQVVFLVLGLLSTGVIIGSIVRNFSNEAYASADNKKGENAPEEVGPWTLCPSETWQKSCAARDRSEWCSTLARRSNVYALCFSACLQDGLTWMEQCAWQAIAHLPSVCAGTFSPNPPPLSSAEDGASSSDEVCEARAVCAGCHDGSEKCRTVIEHYGQSAREAVLRALDDDLDEWCRVLAGTQRTWTAAQPIDALTFQDSWSLKKGKNVIIEEHYLYGKPSALSSVFVKQAYSFWRFVLNDPRWVAGRGVQATTRSYFEVTALLDALTQRELEQGAVVFVDVLYQAMDAEYSINELSAEYGVDPKQVLESGNLPVSELSLGVDPTSALDFICVYQHTHDLVKRSKLLRALLAYERPLVLVLAGDLDCRLRANIPDTHHTIIFPNDAACASQVDGYERRIWWPEGLEGLDKPRDFGPVQAVGGLAADALELASPGQQLARRRFLLDCAFTVTPRKPSRVSLLRYLEEQGVADKLLQLATASGRRVRLTAAVSQIGDSPARTFSVDSASSDRDDEGAVFVLAPAGDTWSSGRVLEALLDGAIPIVDQTYLTDNISAKGCNDAAKFWRDGAADFPRSAPFVFIDNWNALPQALVDAGALDSSRLDARLEAVANYRDLLLVYLREKTLNAVIAAQAASPNSACYTVVFNATVSAALTKAQAEYYSSPDWFQQFEDSPLYPGSGCTTYYTDGRKTHGAMCFDPACAPPTVQDFHCHLSTTE